VFFFFFFLKKNNVNWHDFHDIILYQMLVMYYQYIVDIATPLPVNKQ